ncbi:MAG: MFS transporter [Bradyrhizobiaceae bacterium]|nr:MFS transporter [Bradyrhizobiaceae bacterium]
MTTTSAQIPVRALAFLAAASFASAASLRACDPILPEIASAFSTTPGDAARVITYFGAAYALAQFAHGFIGDRFGHLRTVAFATAFSAVTSLVCAASTSLDMLAAARIGVGLTAAAIIPLSMAWLGEVVPYEKRQTVLARYLSGQISGLVLGQVFAGVIAEHFGWRFVFVVLAALFLAAGVALMIEVRRNPDPVKRAEGSASAMARLLAMLHRPRVAIILAAAFLEGVFFFGAYTFVGSFLWARFGLGFDLVGLIVAGFGVGGLIYSASAARLLRHLGQSGLVAWGGLLMAVSFVIITISVAPLMAVPATILAGFSYYMLHNTLQTAATQMAPEARGLAVATFASCLFLGQAAGVAVAAPIFDNTGGAPLFLSAGVLLFVLGLVLRTLITRRS